MIGLWWMANVYKGENLIYILLNKPKGVLTTLTDPQNRKTVASLVADIPERIYPVGRLDYNTRRVIAADK